VLLPWDQLLKLNRQWLPFFLFAILGGDEICDCGRALHAAAAILVHDLRRDGAARHDTLRRVHLHVLAVHHAQHDLLLRARHTHAPIAHLLEHFGAVRDQVMLQGGHVLQLVWENELFSLLRCLVRLLGFPDALIHC